MQDLIARTLTLATHSRATTAELPDYFYAALNSLIVHYTVTGRHREALDLVCIIMAHVDTFVMPEWVSSATHGLIAKGPVHMGRQDLALKELSLAFDANKPMETRYGAGQNAALAIDAARLHVASGDYASAVDTYETCANSLGGLIRDREMADTTRLRFYWLQRNASVVHELVSVWLDIPDETAGQRVEATVANAVLRLKADIFMAIEAHKLLRWSPGHDLFTANRRYAVTARKVMRSPGDEGALLELEDALFQREDIERGVLSERPGNEPICGANTVNRSPRRALPWWKSS